MDSKSLRVFVIFAFTVVVALTIEGIISPLIGIILAVIIAISPLLLAILSALLSVVFTNVLASKPKLDIKNCQFVKRFSSVEGYQLRATITNKGKKICENLDAKFKITDSKGESPNLQTFLFENNTVKSTEETAMRDIEYAWIDENENLTLGVWKQLRLNDSISLLFPHESTFYSSGNTSEMTSHASEVLLKLSDNVRYNVTVEVKGEYSEKNTIMKTQKFSLAI